MSKPMILVSLHEMPGSKNRLSETPAHIRVAAFEPTHKFDEKEEQFGLINPKAGIRWFTSPGQSFAGALSEIFSFKPAPSFKYNPMLTTDFHLVSDVDDPVDVFELRLDQTAESPTIRRYDLGEYTLNDVAYDVVGFTTKGLDTKILNDDYRFSVVYQLDTASRLVEEEFLDHLHVALTGHGFTTLYNKKSCAQFDFIEEIDGVTILRSKAGCRQVVHIRREPHDPTMCQQQLTILAADQKGELFAFDEKGLDLAIRNFHNWNFRVEISPEFKWI